MYLPVSTNLFSSTNGSSVKLREAEGLAKEDEGDR